MLRMLVVCVAASILGLFLCLQQHSPTVSTELGTALIQDLHAVRSASSVQTNTHQVLLQNQPLIDNNNHGSYQETRTYVPLDITQELVKLEERIVPPSDQDVISGSKLTVFMDIAQPDNAIIRNRDEHDDRGHVQTLATPLDKLASTDDRKALPVKPVTLPTQDEAKYTAGVNSDNNKTIEDTLMINVMSTLRENSHQRNQTRYIPAPFLLDSSFQLPWHRSKSVSSIMQQDWYLSLILFLQKSTPNRPIVLVAADEYFKSALINWLIFSLVLQENPVKNLLILTYDPSICSFIKKRQLTDCLHVPPATLTAPDLYDHRKYGGLYPLLVVRVVIMRVLNRLGYDVANFDSDAILLRNPIPVFEEYPDSDVIGTYGGGLPGNLLKKWGVVVCMGAIFLRSTKSTGMYFTYTITILGVNMSLLH